jgi:magnesium-transporting ATPase (P-type)
MDKEIKNNSEIIKEIQDRFRFILLVAIFFYTVMSKLSDIYNNDKSGEFAVAYAGVVAIYFVIYFLFEIFKNKCNLFSLKIINIFIFAGVGMFIIPIILLSLMGKIPTQPLLVVFKFSILGIILIPIIFAGIFSWVLGSKKK